MSIATTLAAPPTVAPAAAPQAARSASQRLYVLDLARFLAMVMMMQGHTLDALVTPSQLDINTYPWNIWHFLRGLTAPVFLMISGAVWTFAAKRGENGRIPNQTLLKRARWAVVVALIGYMLMFPANRLFDLFWVPTETWKQFFQVNILQLNGASLLLLTGLAALTRSNEQLGKRSLITGLVIALATPFVHQLNPHGTIPEGIAAFFSYRNGSIFPIFPFSAYLFFGAALGVWLQRFKGEDRLKALKMRAIPGGAAILSVGIALSWLAGVIPGMPAHDYYQMSPGFVLVRAGLVTIFVGLVSWLYGATRRYENVYSMFGKKALHIYVGHLILLYGTPWFPSIARWHVKDMPLAEGLGIAALVVGICLGAVAAMELFKNRVHRGEKIMRFSGALILAYLLLV